MRSYTFTHASLPPLQQAIESVLETGYQPTLAWVFASPHFPYAALSQWLGSKGMEVAGATSAGEIIDDAVEEDGAVVMLMDLPAGSFTVLMEEAPVTTYFEVASQMARQAQARFADPSILMLFSHLEADGEQVIEAVQQVLGPDVPMAGGMAGDELAMEATYVFSAERVSGSGIIFVVLDQDQIEMINLASSGWQGVGLPKTVTASIGNRVLTIDDTPALEVYRQYFGLGEGDVAQKIIEIGIHYPLQILREDKPPLLRAPMVGHAEDQSVTFAGGVAQGVQVKLSIAPGPQITQQLLEEYAPLQAALPQPEAMLMFSCIGRYNALGSLIEDEIEAIYALWKQPMVGFFTYGEIGNLTNDNCSFHNETCVLTLLREKKPG